MRDVSRDRSASAGTPHAALVSDLERCSIPYVYWKPGSGAALAMRGGSKDLDLVVDPRRLDDARGVLSRLGYKQFLLPAGAVPDSEAWVAWDARLDRFYFAHLCWRLHTGRPGVYEQELPWVDALLEHAHPSSAGVRVLGPEAELLVMATRAVFEPKLSARSTLPSPPTLDVIDGARRTADSTTLRALAGSLFPGYGDEVTETVLDPELASLPSWQRWRALARDCLAGTRLSPAQVELRRASAALVSWSRAAERRARAMVGFADARPGGRLRREGGLLVALIGPDGAGKSTINDALVSWLGELFDVESLYLGRGEWVSRAQQLAAEVKWAILERTTSRVRPGPTPPADDDGRREPGASPKERRVRWIRDAAAVALAERKRRTLWYAERLRRRGWLLVTDRFPHATEKLCDGPAIVLGEADPPARRLLARAERYYFRGIVGTRADLLVRLLLPAEESIRRKPDHRPQDIRAKLAAARRAHFPAVASIDVAADAPLAEVLRTIKSALWAVL